MVSGNTVGAAQQHFNITVAKELRFRVPPKLVQDKIAAVLSAYDELIENNRQRITLLEKLAEEIYREWFVRLRFPGHEKVRAIKGVPQGWSIQPASEAFHVMGGGTPKTEVAVYWDGEIPFFTPKDSHVGFYVLDTEKKLTEKGLQSCSSQLFPPETIFITARGTVGELCLAHRPMAMNQSCYALAPRGKQSVYFHFLAMKLAITYIKGISKSGVFDNIVIDTFKNVPIRMPTADLLRRFNETAKPIFGQIGCLLQSNVQLAKTRDKLLPRLISGKLSVENLAIQFPPGMAEETEASGAR
jgi:type I restriction enzyme S subunit